MTRDEQALTAGKKLFYVFGNPIATYDKKIRIQPGQKEIAGLMRIMCIEEMAGKATVFTI